MVRQTLLRIVALTTLNVWKATARNLDIFRGVRAHRPYCAKYIHHAEHVNVS